MNLSAVPSEWLLVLIALAVCVALVQTVRLWWGPFTRRAKFRKKQKRAIEGEHEALQLLQRRGYEVLGSQVSVRYPVWVDDQAVAIELRADYIVSHQDKCYVAEVKTGKYAPRIHTPATRRQLLEYRMAFDVDGVLLVDADSATVHRIEFSLPTAEPQTTGSNRWLGWLWLLVGVVLGAVSVGMLVH